MRIFDEWSIRVKMGGLQSVTVQKSGITSKNWKYGYPDRNFKFLIGNICYLLVYIGLLYISQDNKPTKPLLRKYKIS